MFNGERLAKLRKSRGLTQGQLAEMTEIPRDTISAYERNRYNPGSRAKCILAKFFNISLDYLHDLIDDEISFDKSCYIILPENSPPELKDELEAYLDFLKMNY